MSAIAPSSRGTLRGLGLATRLTRSAVDGGRLLNCLWELTYRCDARCTMCVYWRRETEAADELDTDDVRRGLDRVAVAGCRAVNFTGGEPTLRHDLETIVAHAAGRGMWVSMVTNGLTLDRARVRALKAAGVVNLFVSVDSADPAVHDAHRGVDGGHARALATVRLLADEFLGAYRTAGIMTVVTRQNEGRLGDLVDLAVGLGVDLVVQPYHRRVADQGGLEAQDLGAAVGTLRAHPRARDVLVNTTQYLERMGRFSDAGRFDGCRAGRKYVSVDPLGGVHACVDLPAVGHVLDHGLDALRSAEARDAVRSCRGCWYCFRGEADGLLTPRGYAQKVALAASVCRRNARRRRGTKSGGA